MSKLKFNTLSSFVKTEYTINTEDAKFAGTMNVPAKTWEYSVNEFSDFVIGIPNDPVLDYIIKKLGLQIEMYNINYWTVCPTSPADQIKYFGCIQDEV